MSSVFEGKNISSTIVKLGVPAMLGQLATLIYNLADTYFVSLTKSADQIAAVTLCVPVLLIIMSVACVFGMGVSSVIARQLGEGKKEDSAKCLNFCLYSIALSGVLVLAAGLLVLKPAAYVIGADEGNLGYTCDYLKWIFVGAPFIMLSNGLTHSLRAVGLIKESTVGIAVGNGVNIVLDWLFIVIFHMGTAGAALATSIGFLCATVYYIGCLAREERSGNELVTLSPGSFRPTKGMVRNVVVIGIPGALITVMMSVSNIVLNNYIGIYGSDAVASYGIAYKIDMFPIMLSVGLSQGVAPLLGFYYGAGRGKRLEQAMRISMVYGMILGGVFTVLFMVFSRGFASIFLYEEVLISQTAGFLRLLCFHAPLLGIINMVISYFQALGRAASSLAITVLRNVVLFIPGVMVLNYLWKLNGVILTQLVVEGVLTVICLMMYRISSPGKLVSLKASVGEEVKIAS